MTEKSNNTNDALKKAVNNLRKRRLAWIEFANYIEIIKHDLEYFSLIEEDLKIIARERTLKLVDMIDLLESKD